MTDKLIEQLRPLSEAKVDDFGAALGAKARAGGRAAVEIYLSGDDDSSDKAQMLLPRLEENAIVPLTEVRPAKVDQRIWTITTAVQAEIELRRKVIARLNALLDDKTPMPQHTAGPVERKLPTRRVCDQAYLLMRKVVHLGEPLEDAMVQESLFLNLPEHLKDAQISKARHSGIWNRALTGHEMDDEPVGEEPAAGPPPAPKQR